MSTSSVFLTAGAATASLKNYTPAGAFKIADRWAAMCHIAMDIFQVSKSV
jgi:hypothetical protein